MNDQVELLRRYEPVIRYTAGELFLPTRVDGYLRQCSLWQRVPGHKRDRRLLAPGTLTPGRLAELGERHRTEELFLRFVERPLGSSDYRRWRRESDRHRFRPSSRFAPVGLTARLVDAGLRLSLLLRGTVPGGTRAAAQRLYSAHLEPADHPYYGHVSRDGGYLVLQYWYFYAMNDWRSTFGGINDHEADWEQVTIFLAEPPVGSAEPAATGAEPVPAWVVYSAHDHEGDSLRRRWDDPDLERVGDHPVVYAGAGSHAGAYRRGEYVTTVAWPGQRGFVRGLRAVARRLSPTSTGVAATSFGIPFLEYHRGDGPGIGPGETRRWSPVLVDDDVTWIRAYRGLWGLDTRDRFGGERAPAGPRYERDGSIRVSWDAPVTWAQLDAEYPTEAHGAILRERRATAVDRRLAEIASEIDRRRDEWRQRRAGALAIGVRPAGPPDVAALHVERRALVEERDALVRARTDPPAPEPPQASVRDRAVPLAEPARPQRFLAVWSALSASVMLGGVALILLSPPLGAFWSIIGLLVIMLAIEAAAQAQFARFVRGLVATVVAASVAWSVAEVAVHNWRAGAAAILVFGALALLTGNIRAWLAQRPSRR